MLGKTVKQLLNELDSSEITEWQAYVRILNKAHGSPQSNGPEAKPGDTQQKSSGVKDAMHAVFGHRVKKKERKK